MERDSSRRSARRQRKGRLKLKRREQEALAGLMGKGRESARVIKRARILRMPGEGKIAREAAQAAGIVENSVDNVKKRYSDGGLERALKDAKTIHWRRAHVAGRSRGLAPLPPRVSACSKIDRPKPQ